MHHKLSHEPLLYPDHNSSVFVYSLRNAAFCVQLVDIKDESQCQTKFYISIWLTLFCYLTILIALILDLVQYQ